MGGCGCCRRSFKCGDWRVWWRSVGLGGWQGPGGERHDVTTMPFEDERKKVGIDHGRSIDASSLYLVYLGRISSCPVSPPPPPSAAACWRLEPPRMTDAPGGAGRRQVGLRRRGSRRVRPGGAGEMCRHQEQTRPPPPAAKGRGCSLPSEGGREGGGMLCFLLPVFSRMVESASEWLEEE